MDLDASSLPVVLQRHLIKPLAATEALAFSPYLTRERNDRGFNELSYRSAMLSASLQWRWMDLDWSAGPAWQSVHFDDLAFAQDPVRIDRARSLELAVEHRLSTRHTVRFEYSHMRNVSTPPVYDNQYQQLAFKLHSAW